jgi:exosome complex component RRP45
LAKGRTSEDETIISRLLEKALRQSNAIDRESLCIVAGEKVNRMHVAFQAHARDQVWSLRIDLHFLDDQGNLIDCASIAAMAALLHFRKPEVTVAGYDVTIVSLVVSSVTL